MWLCDTLQLCDAPERDSYWTVGKVGLGKRVFAGIFGYRKVKIRDQTALGHHGLGLGPTVRAPCTSVGAASVRQILPFFLSLIILSSFVPLSSLPRTHTHISMGAM
jgi:hypothetical protein